LTLDFYDFYGSNSCYMLVEMRMMNRGAAARPAISWMAADDLMPTFAGALSMTAVQRLLSSRLGRRTRTFGQKLPLAMTAWLTALFVNTAAAYESASR
jgi:hypothetical protein